MAIDAPERDPFAWADDLDGGWSDHLPPLTVRGACPESDPSGAAATVVRSGRLPLRTVLARGCSSAG